MAQAAIIKAFEAFWASYQARDPAAMRLRIVAAERDFWTSETDGPETEVGPAEIREVVEHTTAGRASVRVQYELTRASETGVGMQDGWIDMEFENGEWLVRPSSLRIGLLDKNSLGEK